MAFFARPSSTAIKIVNPNTQDDPSSSTPASPQVKQPQPRKDSVQRQCRNIVIYGHCKFQDKGCIYYHPPAPGTTESAYVEFQQRSFRLTAV
ncbi:hypothetical protein BDQ12DRAFT_241505 [Crucibulum laeve]|uniref:C3H1-type domain-containing protein n=1 Tax=Crucibulum laeve TaxID=68775 RepID=A0A5C3LVT7_9AGAR|nr:hypothetical protein BDQ12DRAFT_241505 [Crucibulum laeve]